MKGSFICRSNWHHAASVFFFSIFVFVMHTCAAWGAVIHVPSDQPTIQKGINAAKPGDTVLIADGTYGGAGNVELDLRGKAITVKSKNGPNRCIIDGSSANRAFYLHNGETRRTVISGLTIMNGKADFGGAIWSNGSSTIRNCVFIRNSASFSGGAVFLGNASASPLIDSCVIVANMASWYGGGLYCNASARVTNCTIWGNTATGLDSIGSGGGIFVFNSSPTISDCAVLGNSAVRGGGMLLYGTAVVENCVVNENTAEGIEESAGGGGIYFYNFASTIRNSDISSNRGQNGGGLFTYSASPSVLNCSILNNGAVNNGGGLHDESSSAVIPKPSSESLTNCVISGNTAIRGGGLSSIGSSPRLRNCTLINNAATQRGGALYFEDALSGVVVNSIAWNNTPQAVFSKPSASGFNLTYCNVEGGYTGEGNVDSAPKFSNISRGDFHLTSGSPCVGAGTNDTAKTKTDRDGLARLMYGTIDMGAYEYRTDMKPMIAIHTTKAVASEVPGTNAVVAITRTGNTTIPVTVHFEIRGTAVAGDDYEVLPQSVQLGANELRANLTIKPMADGVAEEPRIIRIVLQDSNEYGIQFPNHATTTVVDAQ